MKWNRLPFLVQRIILVQMNYKTIFNLSLVSTKTRKLVENNIRKNVKSIKYCFSTHGMQVVVEDENGSQVTIVEAQGGGDRFQFLNNPSLIRIGNVPEPVVFHKRESRRGDGQIVTYFNLNYEKSIKSAICEHVSSLFHLSTPTIHLEVQMINLRKLVKIPGVLYTKLFGDQVEGKFLDDLFNNHPNQNTAIIDPELTGELSADSKLFDVQNLYCKQTLCLAVPIIENFNGSELRLFQTNWFDRMNINRFLERWASNQAYQNLRFMWIRPRVNFFNHPPIRIGNFEPDPWMLHPFMFEFQSKFSPTPLSIDCRRGFCQIEREGDRRMAAFRVTNDSFEFMVWNRTRDRFGRIILIL